MPETKNVPTPPARLARTDPLYIVMNLGSGDRDAETAARTVNEILDAAGQRYELLVVDDPSKLGEIAERAAGLAEQNRGAVVAAGGDGTINAVAQATLRKNRPFGVIPQGTFNYFSRAHGISSDTGESTRALLDASIQPVQVGLINDRLFLVNASLGLYPELLERRETDKQKFGRHRFVAFCSGLMTLLREHRQLVLSVAREDGTENTLRTPTLFVGNNPLQLQQIGIAQASAVPHGELAAITVRPIGAIAMLGLALRGAMSKLGDSDNVYSFAFQRMKVRPWLPSGRRRVKVAIDGEITTLATPLCFRVGPSLQLLAPAPASDRRM
ncbi:MAG: diacylglycerol/lipid kinase family protein [Burkholderiales bacterium]